MKNRVMGFYAIKTFFCVKIHRFTKKYRELNLIPDGKFAYQGIKKTG